MKQKILVTALVAAMPCATVLASEPITPIRPAQEINLAQAELGKKLYFDPRLSKSGFISCNSCHNLSMGGTDNLKTSIGHNWQEGPINSPTVLNSSLNVAQFWDGRAADLKEQAAGPIANPGEMAFTHTLAINVLESIPGYVKEFKLVFGEDGIDIDKVTEAIAEFEKTLVTPNSRFDRWLLGDDDALTQDEVAGYELFKDSGCTACHNGAAAGGTTFQKMGVVEPYKTDNPAEGRYAVTGKDADRFNFKVPTLRNVALTYPYFHDGAAWTLEEAVNTMGRIQLGKKFTPEENAQIVAFLKSMTGEQPSFALPILPPSTASTPQPQPFDDGATPASEALSDEQELSPAPAAAEAAPTIGQVQERLRALGYDPGPIDGLWGPSTRRALEGFQRDRGLGASGQMDAATATALGFQ